MQTHPHPADHGTFLILTKNLAKLGLDGKGNLEVWRDMEKLCYSLS